MLENPGGSLCFLKNVISSVCVYVFELLYVAYRDAYLLCLICALDHCAHTAICFFSFFSAHYVFVTSDAASRRFV